MSVRNHVNFVNFIYKKLKRLTISCLAFKNCKLRQFMILNDAILLIEMKLLQISIISCLKCRSRTSSFWCVTANFAYWVNVCLLFQHSDLRIPIRSFLTVYPENDMRKTGLMEFFFPIARLPSQVNV